MDRKPIRREAELAPLSQEHHQALLLAFDCKQAASRTGTATVEEMIARLAEFHRSALVPHFRAEEELLAPLFLRHTRENDSDLGRLLTDHVVLHKLVLELSCTREDQSRLDLLGAFGDRLEGHVRFEERELFPRLEGSFTAEEKALVLKGLGERLVKPGP